MSEGISPPPSPVVARGGPGWVEGGGELGSLGLEVEEDEISPPPSPVAVAAASATTTESGRATVTLASGADVGASVSQKPAGNRKWDIRESDWTCKSSEGYDSDGEDFFSNNSATVNEYTLHEILGRGSFATVRLAMRKVAGGRDEDERPFAVKVYSKSSLRRKGRRFDRREGKWVSSLDAVRAEIQLQRFLYHRNLALLFETIESAADDRDELFLVAEYCAGGQVMDYAAPDSKIFLRAGGASANLVGTAFGRFYCRWLLRGGKLKSGGGGGARGTQNAREGRRGDKGEEKIVRNQAGVLPETLALRYYLDILSALRYLHSRGVAHRDVKPENILLSAPPDAGALRSRALLSDFGCAKQMPTRTRKGGRRRRRRRRRGEDEQKEEDNEEEDNEEEEGEEGEEEKEETEKCSSSTPWLRFDDRVNDSAGTFAFFSPEACTPTKERGGDGYSAFAADLWALSASLFVLVTGAVPYYRPGADVSGKILFDAIREDDLCFPFSSGGPGNRNGNGNGNGNRNAAAAKETEETQGQLSPSIRAFLEATLRKDASERPSMAQLVRERVAVDDDGEQDGGKSAASAAKEKQEGETSAVHHSLAWLYGEISAECGGETNLARRVAEGDAALLAAKAKRGERGDEAKA